MAGNNVTRKNMHGGKIAVGSKAQVFHGTADRTSGGLVKSDLLMNKRGRIVSRKKMEAGKKAIRHLEALGYKAKKGQFKLFTKKTHRNHMGGFADAHRKVGGFADAHRKVGGFADAHRKVGGFADAHRKVGGFADAHRKVGGSRKTRRSTRK
jgi:hypothetical protein